MAEEWKCRVYSTELQHDAEISMETARVSFLGVQNNYFYDSELEVRMLFGIFCFVSRYSVIHITYSAFLLLDY